MVIILGSVGGHAANAHDCVCINKGRLKTSLHIVRSAYFSDGLLSCRA